MAESKAQPTENKAVPEIPVGPLKSATKGNFMVMSIDSEAYQKETAARKSRNRETELKLLDAETRATIEAANAQGKGVMWKKPDGSSYLFTGQKPNEKATDEDKKKKEEKDGFLGWCKRNWGWLLGGAVAIATAAYFLIRNKNKKKDKNKTAVKNDKKDLEANSSTQTNGGASNSGTSNNDASNSGSTNSGTTNDGTTNSSGTTNGGDNTNSGGGTSNNSGNIGDGNSSNDNNNTSGGGDSSTQNDNSSDGNLSVSDTSHSSGNDANTQSSGSSLKDTIHANSGGLVPDDNCGVYDNGLGGGRFR